MNQSHLGSNKEHRGTGSVKQDGDWISVHSPSLPGDPNTHLGLKTPELGKRLLNIGLHKNH